MVIAFDVAEKTMDTYGDGGEWRARDHHRSAHTVHVDHASIRIEETAYAIRCYNGVDIRTAGEVIETRIDRPTGEIALSADRPVMDKVSGGGPTLAKGQCKPFNRVFGML